MSRLPPLVTAMILGSRSSQSLFTAVRYCCTAACAVSTLVGVGRDELATAAGDEWLAAADDEHPHRKATATVRIRPRRIGLIRICTCASWPRDARARTTWAR